MLDLRHSILFLIYLTWVMSVGIQVRLLPRPQDCIPKRVPKIEMCQCPKCPNEKIEKREEYFSDM